MSFLKKVFGKKDDPVTDYIGFWNWFRQHEKDFHTVIRTNKHVEGNFLDKIIPVLHQLNQKFYCLAGMDSDTVAELVITAEGDIKVFVFVEELVNAAPSLPGWKFTALKPAIGSNDMSIEMDGYEFNKDTLTFVSITHDEYPDEIEISLLHPDYNEENKNTITNGCLIYLDNALGELEVATLIDNVRVSSPGTVNGDPIPIGKLREFLVWREKEFTEKYLGSRYNTEKDVYSALEATDKEGLPLMAVINSDLMNWDAKPSHPWMLVITIAYADAGSGMPDSDTYSAMNDFEDELMQLLRDEDGYLNLGRETYNSKRKIYFACKEFRNASKVTLNHTLAYSGRLSASYDIYRDKYWMTMNRFQ